MKLLKAIPLAILIFFVSFYVITTVRYVTHPYMYLEEIENKAKYGEIMNKEDAIYSSLIRLKNKDNKFFCSGFVIDGRYAMTAAHCVDDVEGPIRIYDKNDTFTGTEAKVLGYNHRNDTAVIYGDFTNFKAANIEKDVHGFVTSKGPFLTCGYPYGQKAAYCEIAMAVEAEDFAVKLLGVLVPGMSGGPVVDLSTNKVVGLNTAVEGKFIICNPIVGALGFFEIDQ